MRGQTIATNAPIALGFLVRAISTRAATALIRVSDVVYAVGVVGCVAAMVAEGAPLALRIPRIAYVAAVVVTIGDVLVGYWAGGPDKDDQKAIALAAAMGNPALALAVAEVSYPDHTAGALVAAYLLVRGIVLVPVEWWLKRLRDERRRARPLRRSRRPRRASAH